MNNRTSVATLQRQSTYELGREIQKREKITGGFGKTFYKATWLNGENLPIVLLEMKGNKVEVEALLYITLHHTHIIKTYGLVNPNDQLIGSDSVLLLQEYAKDGDIARLLSAQHFIPSQYVLIEIFIQISSAMIYLAENDIIHGDLACRNALVFKSDPHDPKKNLIKLIDFGLTHNELFASDIEINIPVRYAAPEILRSRGRSNYSERSDVYSFAVLMWEACSFGKMPYSEIYDDEEVCKQKLHGKILTRPDKCDPNLWKLMIVCWNDRFHDRPTFNMIHKQLESIQNVQPSSSSLLSNSMLLSSSSSIVEKHPCLFAIIYEHCHDCHLPYTDYDSHLDSCREKILRCFLNSKQHPVIRQLSGRSTSFDDSENRSRRENTRRSMQFDSNSSLSSRPNTIQNRKSSDIHMVPLDDNKSTIHRTKSDIQENLSNFSTIIQVPCEICNRPIVGSQYQTHLKQCNENDRRRLVNKRRQIELSKITVKVECLFCRQRCSLNESENHQNKCSFNPKHIPDVSDIQSTGRRTSIPNDISSTPSFQTDHLSGNTSDQIHIPFDDTTKNSFHNNNQQLSCFQKFLSCLQSFFNKHQLT
ncbi:unnamed protein product [Rotaria socialis]|uniref:Protein kinase domain-containing protein n=1 Tax=Rotaria socialis TaxID=392032 RepID=A0A818WMI4_9BILA|nr:unnamed protein product [Rotaria socialis]